MKTKYIVSIVTGINTLFGNSTSIILHTRTVEAETEEEAELKAKNASVQWRETNGNPKADFFIIVVNDCKKPIDL